jgi:hypothetical protein
MGVFNGTATTIISGQNSGVATAFNLLVSAVNAFGPSTPYTPTLGGFTAGSGTWVASYDQIEKLVIMQATFTFGSGSAAATAVPTISLPVTAKTGQPPFAREGYFGIGANFYETHVRLASTTAVGLWITGTNGLATTPTTTTPATWASGSTITVGLIYEAA